MRLLRVLILTSSALSPAPAQAEPLHVFRDCDVCPEMIELPLGEFVMGAPADEFRDNLVVFFNEEGKIDSGSEYPPGVKSEGPQHRVRVDIPIAMARSEVTHAEWMACVADGGCNGYVPRNRVGQVGHDHEVLRAIDDPRFADIPSESAIYEAMSTDHFLEIGGNYPVVYISYLDAQSYINWINKKLSTNSYRLPTEAEWEYAARAGTTTRFAQGFEPTADQINIFGEFTETRLDEPRPDLRTLGFPVPVDELDAANPWGFRHMSGNVDEITLSCFSDTYAGWATTSEWLEKSFSQTCERTSRGGAFDTPMSEARPASRRRMYEDDQWSSHGLRIVKELD